MRKSVFILITKFKMFYKYGIPVTSIEDIPLHEIKRKVRDSFYPIKDFQSSIGMNVVPDPDNKEVPQQFPVTNNADDDIDTIIEDLQSLSMSDSGYERAKDLEGFRANGSYDIDTSFIEWLDMLDSDFDDARRENVKRWVKAHDIKPKYEKGTQLVVKEHFTRSPELQVGKVIFVNGFYENEAKYCVSNEKDSKRNVLIIYEKIEQCCVAS